MFVLVSSFALQCCSDLMILILTLYSVHLETVLADSDVCGILLDAVQVDNYMSAMRVARYTVRMLKTASFRLDPSKSGVEMKA
jgi:hypothetical protein